MNVGRGLFRAWIFVTALWFIGIGALAYSLIRTEVSGWKWQYVSNYFDQFEPPAPDPVPAPPPGFVLDKPRAGANWWADDPVVMTFVPIRYQFTEQWIKLVNEGKAVVVSFPDGSLLYIYARMTKASQEQLSRAFWDQRWQRYAEIGKPWAAGLAGPPIALFILGWALLWVGRGFKAATC
jgi:hypothetical protein